MAFHCSNTYGVNVGFSDEHFDLLSLFVNIDFLWSESPSPVQLPPLRVSFSQSVLFLQS